MYIIVSLICHLKKKTTTTFASTDVRTGLIFKILQLKMRDILSHNAHLMRYHECLVIRIRGTHTGIQLESGPRHTSPHKVFAVMLPQPEPHDFTATCWQAACSLTLLHLWPVLLETSLQSSWQQQQFLIKRQRFMEKKRAWAASPLQGNQLLL